MVESMVDWMTAAEARRLTLRSQGFGSAHRGRVGSRQLRAIIDRLQLLQIDSVNVFERAHYLPAFARLGGYDRTLLDQLTYSSPGPYLEYWAHEAAFLPLTDWPLFGWRMREYRDRQRRDPSGWVSGNGALLAWLRTELAERGPLAASQIEHDAAVRRGPWWGWSDVKRGLEHLFAWGEVVSAGRTRFERRYGLAAQLLPSAVREREVDSAAAHRELLRRAALAHGVGTARDFADYFRLRGPAVAMALRELQDAGEIVPVTVAGWAPGGRPVPVWRHRDSVTARRIRTAALLSPFDPVVWERARAERMFGFRYRIEIYTPAARRIFGYYVLPVLLDDRIAGRVDLKSDRQRGVLRVQAAWAETDAPLELPERLAALLAETARWQGLGSVEVADRGTLAAALAAAVRQP